MPFIRPLSLGQVRAIAIAALAAPGTAALATPLQYELTVQVASVTRPAGFLPEQCSLVAGFPLQDFGCDLAAGGQYAGRFELVADPVTAADGLNYLKFSGFSLQIGSVTWDMAVPDMFFSGNLGCPTSTYSHSHDTAGVDVLQGRVGGLCAQVHADAEFPTLALNVDGTFSAVDLAQFTLLGSYRLSAVPEPSSLSLVLGALAGLRRRHLRSLGGLT